MGVLKDISQHEQDLSRYRGRMDKLRLQATYEQRIQSLEVESAEKDALIAQLQAQLAEREGLSTTSNQIDQK